MGMLTRLMHYANQDFSRRIYEHKFFSDCFSNAIYQEKLDRNQ
jgi:hypothetical protein